MSSLLLAQCAVAATVQTFSPQGLVSRIDQVRATFSEPIHGLGDIGASAPFDIACPLAGSGRWIDGRTWVWDARASELDGQSCIFTLKDGLKTLAKAKVDGQRTFAFQLPKLSEAAKIKIARIDPAPERDAIGEHQVFFLHYERKLGGLTSELYCEDSAGQRAPVRRLNPEQAKAIREFSYYDRERTEAVQCATPRPADSSLRLVMVRPGLKDDIFQFQVRSPLQATVSCARRSTTSACIADLPVTLTFNAALPVQILDAITLDGPGGALHGSPGLSPGSWAHTGKSSLTFPAPRQAPGPYAWRFPARVVDVDGRRADPAALPKTLDTDASMAAAFFGATASLRPALSGAQLPVYLRNTSAPLIRELVVGNDGDVDAANAQLIVWLKKLRAVQSALGRSTPASWAPSHAHTSLLNNVANATPRTVPAAGMALTSHQLPLTGYGLHVLEMPSPITPPGAAPIYERSAVLLTNMLVHLKLTAENGAVWVTALDSGKPVAGADVSILDCAGKLLWRGRANAQGIAHSDHALTSKSCNDDSYGDTITAIARHPDASGTVDVSLATSYDSATLVSRSHNVFDNWRRAHPVDRADTVVDRTLLRPGETLHMRHVMRRESMAGLAFVPADELPDQLEIEFDGDGKKWTLPLQWDADNEAVSQFTIPADAKLGGYSIRLRREQGRDPGAEFYSGRFKVAAFRLPLMGGGASADPAGLIGGQAAGLRVDLRFANGGAAKQWPVQVRVMIEPGSHDRSGMRDYVFSRPHARDAFDEQFKDHAGVLFHAQQLVLDDGGAALLDGMPPLPVSTHDYQLRVETTYADPNGEQQTLTERFAVSPAAVRVGIAKSGRAGIGRPLMLSLMVRDLQGAPVAGQTVVLTGARLRENYWQWSPLHQTEQELGTICSASTNAQGMLACPFVPAAAGEYLLIARGTDIKGRVGSTSQQVEVPADLVATKDLFIEADRAKYLPGQSARLRVHTPFATSQAWLTIEREGILQSRVITLTGPVAEVEVPIDGAWTPNVFVSLLALAPPASGQAPDALPDVAAGIAKLRVVNDGRRLRVTVGADRPDYRPRQRAKVSVQVTMPDGKAVPAGAKVTFVAVDEALLSLLPNNSWQLLESLLLERFYATRTTSQLSARAPIEPVQQLSDALERLVGVMTKVPYRQPRLPKPVAPAPKGVRASSEIQRVEVTGSSISPSAAAAPEYTAGDKPGLAPVRALFDTLLLWKAVLPLDRAGKATLAVPLNDGLSRFRLVAVASAGANHFGTGSTTINVTQDVQLASGLPQTAREGDRMTAMLTVRNSSKEAMRLQVSAGADGVAKLAPQTVEVGAGGAREVHWNVTIPQGRKQLTWRFAAVDDDNHANGDRLEVKQSIAPAVPVTVLAATLEQVVGQADFALKPVDQALDGKSSIQVRMQASLAGGMPGVRDWFERYPYTCLEQRWSKALGRKDKEAWDSLMDDLHKYMDNDGLTYYFPGLATSSNEGSDTLTSHLLNTAHEAGWSLPPEAQRQMLAGLTRFAEGKIVRRNWAPRNDMLARKLAAVATLSLYKSASAEQLAGLRIDPDEWTSAMLIDWLTALRHVEGVPNGAQLQAQAENALRARLGYQGRRLVLSHEERDRWWWMMQSGDVDAARLLLAVHDLPAWRDDLPRLLGGLLGRQQAGAWGSTVGNVWGTLAVDRFAARFETAPVNGRSALTLGEERRSVDWAEAPTASMAMPMPSGSSTLKVAHNGAGRPWVTVETLAAVPLTAPLQAGYSVTRTLTPVTQKVAGSMSVGDIWRVTVSVDASADMTWVVVNDPVPTGASILGTGLGRDLASGTQGERSSGAAWEEFRERDLTSLRSYYRFVPRGRFSLDYTIRLNNAGTFVLPPTRVEAMYAPDVFGAAPNAPVTVRE